MKARGIGTSGALMGSVDAGPVTRADCGKAAGAMHRNARQGVARWCRFRKALGMWVAGTIGIGVLLMSGCKAKAPATLEASSLPEGLDLSPQDVAEVVTRTVLPGVRVTGTTEPALRFEIKAQVPGKLAKVLVDRGMVVTQAQAVAISEDQVARAQLDAARAQVSAAERDFTSSELLFKAGAASERSHVNARLAVETAKTQLAQAADAVERGTVTSPVDGVVSERQVSAGEVVSPGQRLFTVVHSGELDCAASVLPADVPALQTGQEAVLTFSAYRNRQVRGKVERIDPVADPKSRRVGVTIRVPNPRGEILAGLFASVTILTNAAGGAAEVLLVPAGAVLESGGGRRVMKVEGGKLVQQEVQLGAPGLEPGWFEVRSGLTSGDRVLLAPSKSVRDGMPVQIRGESAGRH